MAKAYSYIRMSTPEQLKGDSVRRQQKATDDYVKEHNLELTDILQDHGVSAFKGKNVEFGALSTFLNLAESGAIEVGSFLIVESLDRLTRQNIFEAISLLNKIIRLGINVVTLIDRRVYSKESVEKNEADLMIASIIMMRSHEESRTKSIRLSAAWQQKRNQAKIGKVTKLRLPFWLKYSNDGSAIETIEENSRIIVKIFEMSRDGWGAYSIAKWLNEQKIIPWGKADNWQESYIKKIQKNRSVLGEFQPYKFVSNNDRSKRVPDGNPIENYFPRIVDELLFEETQDSISKRNVSGKGRKGAENANLFSGLLKCDLCNSGIRYINKGYSKKGRQYLRCSKAVLTRNCNAISFPYQQVERKLIEIIKDISLDASQNSVEWQTEYSKLKNIKLNYEKSIKDISLKIERVVTAISEVPQSEELLLKLKTLNEEKLEISNKLATTSREISELSITTSKDRLEIFQKLIGNEISAEEKLFYRKKVSAELKRFIKYIKISSHLVGANEEQKSEPQLVIKIVYRNGNFIFYDDAGNNNMHARFNKKFNLMLERTKISEIK